MVQILHRRSRYRIGTTFPKIGSADFPSEHNNLSSALEMADMISSMGYDARVYLEETVTTERALITVKAR